MPKDNEVDENVVAWMLTRKRDGFIRAIYNVKPTDEQIAIAEYDGDVYVPLTYAATVAELRAEVGRLVKALDEAACELSAAGQALAEFEGFEFRQKAAIDRAYAASQKAHDANGYTEALAKVTP